MRQSSIFLLFIGIIFITACKNDPLDIDVSHIDLSLTSRNFSNDLSEAIELPLPERVQHLYQSYGSFPANYFSYVLQLGEVTDSATWARHENISSEDSLILLTNQAINEIHQGKTAGYDREIEDGFKHYMHYFPNTHVPEVVYYNSWFNFAVFPTDSILAIGLDFFLGPEHKVVQLLPPDKFPQYYREKMRPEYIPGDAMRGWLMVTHQDLLKQENLLDFLVWYGKMMYLLEACMPDASDDILINYTSDEWSWAVQNERQIWRELARQEVMFETKRVTIDRWFRDGPFTNAESIPQNSPSRLGIWMGWQIVHDFMEEYPETTIPELLEADNQLVLSAYSPG